MRFVKILNLFILALFLVLWAFLYVKKDLYQGNGMQKPEGVYEDSTYFSQKMPYAFILNNNFYGLTTNAKTNRDVANGIWKLDIKKQKVFHSPIPNDFQFDSLVSVTKENDSTLIFTGLINDSIASIIRYDSIAKPLQKIETPAKIRATAFINNNFEIVFGRQKNVTGSIATVKDTSVSFRKYSLPGFFNRICNILTAWDNNGKWRFLVMTDYYQKDDKWVLFNNKNNSNFLAFDEKAIFPDYIGVLNKNIADVERQFDYTFSGIIPQNTKNEKVILFDEKSLSEKPINKLEKNHSIFIDCSNSENKYFTTSWDNAENEEGSMRSGKYGFAQTDSLFFISDEGKYIFTHPKRHKKKQIFTAENEFPICLLKLKEDSNIFITNKLNYTFLNDNGTLLNQKNFFSIVNNIVLKKYPETVLFLDVEIPQIQALMIFFVLYGLFPLWILSLIISWLFHVLKNKRTKGDIPNLPMRLLPGTALYLIIFIIYIFNLLQVFSINF